MPLLLRLLGLCLILELVYRDLLLVGLLELELQLIGRALEVLRSRGPRRQEVEAACSVRRPIQVISCMLLGDSTAPDHARGQDHRWL